MHQTMLALDLDCSKASLPTTQEVSNRKLNGLKMLEFSGTTRIGISILTPATDAHFPKQEAQMLSSSLWKGRSRNQTNTSGSK